MAEKELRRMNRTELIEIIYALQQNEHTLRDENGRLKKQLDDKVLRKERAGSIAEAAMSVNHIFEHAEETARQYLISLEAMSQSSEQMLEDTQRKCDEMLADARKSVEETQEECHAMRAQADREIQIRKSAFARSIRLILEKYPILARFMQDEPDPTWYMKSDPELAEYMQEDPEFMEYMQSVLDSVRDRRRSNPNENTQEKEFIEDVRPEQNPDGGTQEKESIEDIRSGQDSDGEMKEKSNHTRHQKIKHNRDEG